MKSGFIAIVGAPNVGKSSLVNALVGEKVSIVSPKAQTTRDRVMGILTEGDMQMIFVDTPGAHDPKNRLGEYMQKSITSAVKDCDAVVVVLSAEKTVMLKDIAFIKKHLRIAPVFVALNKVDLVGFDRIYPALERLAPLVSGDSLENEAYDAEDGNAAFSNSEKRILGDKTGEKSGRQTGENDNKDSERVREIIPISCKTKKNIDLLKKYLEECLTDDVQYFDGDDLSDKPMSFMAGEIIREKTLWLLQDEIPHGIGVIIQKIEDGKKLTSIEADIVCEKDSHKEIIIGEGGTRLKDIGTRARTDLEKLFGKQVFLKLFVKVRKDWRNRASIISDLGYKN